MKRMLSLEWLRFRSALHSYRVRQNILSYLIAVFAQWQMNARDAIFSLHLLRKCGIGTK